MSEYYSKQAIWAFIILMISFVVMVLILMALKWQEAMNFSTALQGDVLPLISSLPFVALYLVVLIAATAGYARGAIVARSLPLNQVFKDELQKKKMDRASIKTTIRSGNQVTEDTPMLQAITNLVSSRVPILAVLDSSNKVTGVITGTDIMARLQKEIESTDADLNARLNRLTVRDLQPAKPVVATTDGNLQEVLGTMIRRQFTKLIVVESEQGKEFAGTVDALDLIGEILEGSSSE